MLEGRQWQKAEAASPSAIERLKAVAPIPLPDSYLLLLAYSNGGEGPLPVQPLWLCLYPAEEVVEIEQSGTTRSFFPNLFAIGGNGAGELIALDFRGAKPFPLVAFDMTNSNSSESIRPIAPSFDAALAFIGRDRLP